MKVKAIRTFRDKYTKEVILKGSEIEIEEERCAEINSTSFGVLVEEIKVEAKGEVEASNDNQLIEEPVNIAEETAPTDKTTKKTSKK